MGDTDDLIARVKEARAHHGNGCCRLCNGGNACKGACACHREPLLLDACARLSAKVAEMGSLVSYERRLRTAVEKDRNTARAEVTTLTRERDEALADCSTLQQRLDRADVRAVQAELTVEKREAEVATLKERLTQAERERDEQHAGYIQLNTHWQEQVALNARVAAEKLAAAEREAAKWKRAYESEDRQHMETVATISTPDPAMYPNGRPGK